MSRKSRHFRGKAVLEQSEQSEQSAALMISKFALRSVCSRTSSKTAKKDQKRHPSLAWLLSSADVDNSGSGSLWLLGNGSECQRAWVFAGNGTLRIENQVLHFEDYPGSKTRKKCLNFCRLLRQPVTVQGILVGIIYDKYGSLHRAKCDAFGLLLTYWIGNPLLNYLVKAGFG